MQSRSHMHSSTSRTTMQETNTQISEHVEKRLTRKKIKDNSINGCRRKIPSEKNGVRQVLHSRETQHSSRFDLHELDTEARISQRPDCGKKHAKVEASNASNTKRSKQKSRVEWKNGNQKTHRNDCGQSRDGTKTKR